MILTEKPSTFYIELHCFSNGKWDKLYVQLLKKDRSFSEIIQHTRSIYSKLETAFVSKSVFKIENTIINISLFSAFKLVLFDMHGKSIDWVNEDYIDWNTYK